MQSLWKFGGLRWRQILKHLWQQFWKDDLMDQAAMLSFYFILAIFPLLLFLVALLGLMLQSATALHQALHNYLAKVAPASASVLIEHTLLQIQSGSGSGTLSASLVFSLYFASTGVIAIMDALNVAYGVQESRPWWKQRLIALALTIGSALSMAVAMILIGYGDHLAVLVAGHLGVRGGLIMTGWRILHWTLVVGFALMAFNLLYLFAPSVRHRRWHWLMPGTVLAMALWILVSYAFKLYLSFFNQYNLTYGSIAAVIILLMWFWLSGIALLLGGELNSLIETRTHRVQPPPPQSPRSAGH